MEERRRTESLMIGVMKRLRRLRRRKVTDIEILGNDGEIEGSDLKLHLLMKFDGVL